MLDKHTMYVGLLFATFGEIAGKDPTPMWLELFRRLRRLAVEGVECETPSGLVETRRM